MQKPDHFIPAVQGLRAVAALGILTTHVAFQTATNTGSFLARVVGRFDLWVAVFFALSGFLLWRRHAVAVRRSITEPNVPHPSAGRYFRSRITRILPAYLVLVTAVMLLLPSSRGLSGKAILANFTLTQIYVPMSLTDGLTHMWSLAVEVAFYILLPLLGCALWWLRGTASRVRWRVPVLTALGVICVGWAWIPQESLPGGINLQTQLPAFLPWFVVGMVLAEYAADQALGIRQHLLLHRWARHGWVCAGLGVVLFALAATPLLGPEGFTRPAPHFFAARIVVGAAIAWCALLPLVMSDSGMRQRILVSAPFQALGRWSYGIFLWHLVVLRAVFPILGVSMFGGHMVLVWAVTVLFTIPVAALSYALVEEPIRGSYKRWEKRRQAARTRSAALDRNQVSNQGETAAATSASKAGS
ncbi:MAG TPA: acyltransferase [Corynebacteriales bacterium]|nr:acyltransferase [Mycobacteriales bacterium]